MIEGLSDALQRLLGLGLAAGDIGSGQMALRAMVLYGFTLFLVRLGSKRFLGKATAFDVIIGIMIGSVMSRGINGSAALVPTIAGGAMLVGIHWLFAVLAFHTDWFGNIVKGHPIKLIEDGQVDPDAMRETSISDKDLEESLRLEGMQPDPSNVQLAHMERDGNISVIPKDGEPRVVEVEVAEGVQTVRLVIE